MRPLTHVLRQDVTRQVVLRQPLLNDDVRARLRVVQARAHRAVPPVNRRVNRRLGERLVSRVRVVHHNDRSTLARHRRAHRRDQSLATLVIRESRLRVLVRVQLEPLAPMRLIPRRFNQSPALHRVPERQLAGIRGMEKLHAGARRRTQGLLRPAPRRQGNRGDTRLAHARRNVDQQTPDLPIDHGLQVLGHRLNRPAIPPRRRINVSPRARQEQIQTVFTLGTLQIAQLLVRIHNHAVAKIHLHRWSSPSPSSSSSS